MMYMLIRKANKNIINGDKDTVCFLNDEEDTETSKLSIAMEVKSMLQAMFPDFKYVVIKFEVVE